MMISFQNEETVFNLTEVTGFAKLTGPESVLNRDFLRKMGNFGVFANSPSAEITTTTISGQTIMQIWSDDTRGYFIDDEGSEVCSDRLMEALMEILSDEEMIEIEGFYIPIDDKRIDNSATYLKRAGRILEDNIRTVTDTSKNETRNIMRKFEVTEACMEIQSATSNIVFLDHFRRIKPK